MTNIIEYLKNSTLDIDIDFKNIIIASLTKEPPFIIDQTIIDQYLLTPKKISIKKCIDTNKLQENVDYINVEDSISMTLSALYYCLINLKLKHSKDMSLLYESILTYVLPIKNENNEYENDSSNEFPEYTHCNTTDDNTNEIIDNEQNDMIHDKLEYNSNELNDIGKNIKEVINDIHILDKKISQINDNVNLIHIDTKVLTSDLLRMSQTYKI
jgi:hypothetical protein